MLTALKPVPVVLTTAALLLAGCGGGDKPLTKAEFVSQGNKVCADLNAKVAKIPEPTSIDDLPAYADQLDGVYDQLISGLGDLTPPKDLKSDFTKLKDSAKDAQGTVGELKDAAKAKDQQKITQVTDKASAQDKASDALANKLGLKTCTEG